MAKIKFTNKQGKNANDAIKKANMKVLNSTFKNLIKGVTDAAILLESEEKRAIKNFPVVDTGRFLNSISNNIKVEESKQFVNGKVGSTIKDPKYPMFLEFGTSKMSPHPTMRPTWNKNLSNIKKIINKSAKQGIDKGTK